MMHPLVGHKMVLMATLVAWQRSPKLCALWPLFQ